MIKPKRAKVCNWETWKEAWAAHYISEETSCCGFHWPFTGVCIASERRIAEREAKSGRAGARFSQTSVNCWMFKQDWSEKRQIFAVHRLLIASWVQDPSWTILPKEIARNLCYCSRRLKDRGSSARTGSRILQEPRWHEPQGCASKAVMMFFLQRTAHSGE